LPVFPSPPKKRAFGPSFLYEGWVSIKPVFYLKTPDFEPVGLLKPINAYESRRAPSRKKNTAYPIFTTAICPR
jgi:hypothetical protein